MKWIRRVFMTTRKAMKPITARNKEINAIAQRASLAVKPASLANPSSMATGEKDTTRAD